MATESSDSSEVVSPDLSSEDLLSTYNEMFKNRYSEDDEEYMKIASKPLAPPPCVTGWFSKRRYDGGRRGNWDNRNWRGGYNQQQNWNRGDRGYRGGYQDQRGYQDRRYDNQGHYGGRGGGYHNYRGQQQRYWE